MKGTGGPAGDECQNLVAHTLSAEGADASEDGTGRGTPLVVSAAPEVAATMTGGSGDRGYPNDTTMHAGGYLQVVRENGGDATIGFSHKDGGGDAAEGVAPTLRAMEHQDGSGSSSGGNVAVGLSLRGRDGGSVPEVEPDGVSPALRSSQGGGDKTYVMQERMESPNPENGPNGRGWDDSGAAFTMESRNKPQSVVAPKAFQEVRDGTVGWSGEDGSITPTLNVGGGKPGQGHQAVADNMAVRRITPREAERLQGFPDDWTLVSYRGKPMADGPRYRMVGNAWAVNVARWVGERIQMFDDVVLEK